MVEMKNFDKIDNPDDIEGVKKGDLNLYILTNVSGSETGTTQPEST